MIYFPLKELLDLSDSGVWGDEDTKGGISVLRSTNFRSNGTLDFTKLSFRAVEERKRSAKTLEVGDILLEKSGGGPQQPVGRVCLYRGHAIPHSFGNFIARLRPKEQILSEFLFYFLWYFHATGKTSHYQKQTTGIRNLETQRFFTIEVPVPSLPEQRRIVDLLSRAEGIVRLRREAEKKAAELIPALFNDMFGDPATNPKGWPVAKISDLCNVQTGATPSRENLEYYEGGDTPWVKTGEIKGDTITKADEFITESAVLSTNCKVFPVGTIVVAMYGQGQTRGRSAVLGIPAATNQACAAILPTDSMTVAYMFCFLQTQYEQLRSMARGGNQANLNLAMIKSYQIALPPLTLQAKFAEKLDAIRSIQSQQSTATTKAQATFDALLARCFAPTAATEGGSSD